MKLVTFNIRYDNGHDGKNNFCFRKDLILAKLRQEQPDVICFQEVLPHVAAWLKEVLAGYYVLGCPRSQDFDGEQVSVAYQKDRYNLLKMDTYWLSPTPDIPGSRYPLQSICPRLCTEVVLQEISTGKMFRVVNTHLDHERFEARVLGMAQILRRIDEATFLPQIPVIVTGDLNADVDTEELRLISSHPGFMNLSSGIGFTFHNFGRESLQQIDHIFARGDVRLLNLEKWTDEADGVYLSDHYPVCVELQFT